MPPSRTAILAILVPTRSPFYEISTSQKSGHVLAGQVFLRKPIIPPGPPLYQPNDHPHMHGHHEATMGLAGVSLGRELRALALSCT
eukprot:scaffold14415_cov56-Phaeocystis_antarctica.AAC.1